MIAGVKLRQRLTQRGCTSALAKRAKTGSDRGDTMCFGGPACPDGRLPDALEARILVQRYSVGAILRLSLMRNVAIDQGTARLGRRAVSYRSDIRAGCGACPALCLP